MMMLTPRLLVAVVVLGAVTIAVQSRPTDNSDEDGIERDAGIPDEPSNIFEPVKILSEYGQILRDRLTKMSEQDLVVLEAGLRPETQKYIVPDQDSDAMMGDMPSADEPEDSSSPATMLSENLTSFRERDKKLRLQTIHNQIINFMGRNTQIQPPSPMIKTNPTSIIPIPSTQQRDAFRVLFDNINNFQSYPSDMFTEKTQSFYPTCELPKHTNEEVWTTRETMNLMFNISLPKSSKGISVNVNTARLRLYKQLVPCYSQTSNETDDSQPCQLVSLEETSKRPNTNLSPTSVVPIQMEDRQIRVSIYAYTRSLKRKRVKRKLLDSRMLPYYSDKWTEWNIRNAVNVWHKTPARNFGISVEVEDEDGNLLPVNKFFIPMNCTGDAQTMTPKPMPGFLMEAVHNDYGVPVDNPSTANNTALAFSFNMHRYPIIDITTVEVPESEAKNALLYQFTKNAFEQQFADKGTLAVTPLTPSLQGDQAAELQHRTRHGSRQHRNNGTIVGGLSKDGHELRDQIIVQAIIPRNAQHLPPTTELPE